MSDDELIELAQSPSELTDSARTALDQVISTRKLTLPSREERESRSEETPVQDERSRAGVDSSNDTGRELADLCVVWGRRDALNIQRLLDVAGICFFMGSENATNVNDVVSNFPEGVDVKVMHATLPWARNAVRKYEPKDEPAEIKDLDDADVAVRCPKCHSTDVTFEGGDGEGKAWGGTGPNTFRWSCDSCAHKWEDNGLACRR